MLLIAFVDRQRFLPTSVESISSLLRHFDLRIDLSSRAGPQLIDPPCHEE